ncbi:MAG: recombinase family protein [Thermoplasmatota archaeon]
MKVALYARVSKADESQTPENQLLKLRQYAKERDWEVFGEYVDMASGADANRPQLDRMMADARGNRFKLVLTVKVDRMARSTINLYAILQELADKAIAFECTDQDISTNSPTGKLLLSILAGVAEFERDLIRDRTKAGLARARTQGKVLGHPRLEVDVGRLQTLRTQGMSYRAIGKALGISHQTVKNRLRNEGSNPPKEKTLPGGT